MTAYRCVVCSDVGCRHCPVVPLPDRHGRVKALALVDPDVADELGERVYLSSHGYPRLSKSKTYLHRHVMGCKPGDGRLVDHANGDKLDNRRSNLRLLTHAENIRNMAPRPQCGRSSKYRNVYWKRRDSKWVVNVRVNGKTMYLGKFADEDEAGTFARVWLWLNFPFLAEPYRIRAGASRPSLALTVAAGRSPLPRPAATPPSSRLPDWKQRGLLNAHRWEEPR